MKLILHIGMEKTGTTSLQQWLFQNKILLSNNGFGISEILGEGNNRKLPSYFIDDYDDENIDDEGFEEDNFNI